MLPSVHSLMALRGSPRQCGKCYGENQAEMLRIYLKNIPHGGFNSDRRRYAQQCWRILHRWDGSVAEFLRGMARGSGLPLDEICALLCREEFGHTHHCTAMGATGAATRNGAAIIAQSWDDSPHNYPAVQLLRLQSDGAPATLTYAMPGGRWAAAGINEHGLALVWTSAGMQPLVKPRPGVPTYALIAGLLGCRDCAAAIALVRRTRNAGSFIFFIADAGGEVWVLEAIPGRVDVVPCRDLATRANHYQCGAICAAAKQKLPRAGVKWNSQCRARRIAMLAEQSRGHIDGPAIQTIYRDHEPQPGLGICQHADPGTAMSLDSFYAVPARKEFWIARGYPCRHYFARYKV